MHKRPTIEALATAGAPPTWIGSDEECYFLCLEDLDEIAGAIDQGNLEAARELIADFENLIYPKHLFGKKSEKACFEAVLDALTLEVELLEESLCDPRDVGICSADFFDGSRRPTFHPRSVLYTREAF